MIRQHNWITVSGACSEFDRENCNKYRKTGREGDIQLVQTRDGQAETGRWTVGLHVCMCVMLLDCNRSSIVSEESDILLNICFFFPVLQKVFLNNYFMICFKQADVQCRYKLNDVVVGAY